MKKAPGRGMPLSREITLTLLAKLLLIIMLWLLFFSNPVDETLDASGVGNAVFGKPDQVAPVR